MNEWRALEKKIKMMREDLSQIYIISLAMWLNSRIPHRVKFCCCMSIILRWKNECEEKGKFIPIFSTFFFSCARRCSVVAGGWRRELKYFFQTHTADLKKHALVSTTPISFLLLILFNIFSHLTLSSSSSSSSESFVSWESGKWELHDEMSKSGKRKRKTLMWNKSTFNLKWQTQRRGASEREENFCMLLMGVKRKWYIQPSN